MIIPFRDRNLILFGRFLKPFGKYDGRIQTAHIRYSLSSLNPSCFINGADPSAPRRRGCWRRRPAPRRAAGTSTRRVARCAQVPSNKYPPAEPGALNGEPFKAAVGVAGAVQRTLKVPLKVNASGRPRKISTQEGALLLLREKALKGDARALDRLLERPERRRSRICGTGLVCAVVCAGAPCGAADCQPPNNLVTKFRRAFTS
jgi:hypothetical protein